MIKCTVLIFVILFELGTTKQIEELPRILTKDNEIDLNGAQNLKLQCIGEYRLKWALPIVPREAKRWTKVGLNKECDLKSTAQYCIELNVENITYQWTGFYKCEYCAVHMNVRHEIIKVDTAAIYVYVRNGGHIAVSRAKMIRAAQISRTNWILPCRPTFPQVAVSLAAVSQNGTDLDAKYVVGAIFDPKIGFTISSSEHKYYKCKYQWQDIIVESMLLLGPGIDFNMDPNRLLVPDIEFLSEDDRICINFQKTGCFSFEKLYCTTPQNPNSIMQIGNVTNLDLLGLVVEEQCSTKQGPNLHGKSVFSLMPCQTKRQSVSKAKSGLYTCYVHTTIYPLVSTIDAKPYDEHEMDFEVFPENNVCHIHQESYGNITSELVFTVRSYPQASIMWYNNRNLVVDTENSSTKYDIRNRPDSTTLRIFNSVYSDAGWYSVYASHAGTTLKRQIKLIIDQRPQVHLQIDHTLSHNLTMEYFLNCTIYGKPLPKIRWYFRQTPCADNSTCEYKELPHTVERIARHTHLSIAKIMATRNGTVTCEAWNVFGQMQDSAQFRVVKNSYTLGLNLTQTSLWLPIVLIVFITLCALMICVYVKKKRNDMYELDSLEVVQFKNGVPEGLNPDLDLNMQAEFLPYNNNWEFPKDRLRFGRKLGSGAYGTVIQAVAQSIVNGEGSTTVAVKMPQPNVDNNRIRALIGELKILIHLGPHINIVNLLGACTQNIARKELFVILEYCRFGNLHKFLQNNRENFVDMIDRATDHIDLQLQLLKNSTYTTSTTDSSQGISSRDDSQQELGICKGTERNSMDTQDGFDCIKGHLVTTKDLVEWSFQVARGMDYLASKRVLHGDLAARNILLADNNLVKICDFGLSRNLYNYAKYKKRTAEALPMKWLAIETIQDNVFSSKSDVWSFGIVLWEFFSLGMTPYPGLQVDAFLVQKLANGYRMHCPNFAPRFIYNIMTDCWKPLPQSRPAFSQLWEKFYQILEDIKSGPQELYLQTNDVLQLESD